MISPGDLYIGKLNRYYRHYTDPQFDRWNPPDNPNGDTTGSYIICILGVFGDIFTYISYQRLENGDIEAILAQRGLLKSSTVSSLEGEISSGHLIKVDVL